MKGAYQNERPVPREGFGPSMASTQPLCWQGGFVIHYSIFADGSKSFTVWEGPICLLGRSDYAWQALVILQECCQQENIRLGRVA